MVINLSLFCYVQLTCTYNIIDKFATCKQVNLQSREWEETPCARRQNHFQAQPDSGSGRQG